MENFYPGKDLEFTMGRAQKSDPKHTLKPRNDSNVSKDCSDCLMLKQSLSELKKAFSMTEKKYKVLVIQKSELQKELNTCKALHEDLKRNQENLDYQEILKKKNREIEELNQELKKTQFFFQEISQEYESFSVNVSRIEKDYESEEYGRALKEKNLELAKAQAVIKNLNKECEDLSHQLFDIESKRESYLDSYSQDLNSKISALNQELKDCRKKYKDFKAAKWEEIEEYKLNIKTLNGKKVQLESIVEVLNQKFKEIEEMSTYRVGVFCNTYEKIQELEETLIKKDQQIETLKKSYQNLEITQEIELNSLKKSTELILSNLKKPETNDQETKTTPKSSLILKNLKLILKDLLLQDHKLLKEIYQLINTEGNVLQICLLEIDKKSENLHSDFEKWVMRNEELEQRLVEIENVNLNLVKVIKDLQKVLLAKDKQFDDVVRLYSRIGSEMQGTIDFLSVELTDKQTLIVKDILPGAYQYFTKTLSDAHVLIYRRTHK